MNMTANTSQQPQLEGLATQRWTPFGYLWKELFMNAPVALSFVDDRGIQIARNSAFSELVGYSAEELVHVSVADLTREGDREWTRGYHSRLVSGEIDRFSSDKVFVHKDGSHITVSARIQAVRGSDGSCLGLLAAFYPAQERGHVEDQRLRRLLAHSDATVTVVDENGSVLETTGRYQTVLGYPPEFWDNRTIFDLLAPGQEFRALAFRDEVLANPGQRRSTELRIMSATGEQHAIRLHALNMLANPDVRGVILTTINITEERQLFEGLHERTATAEAVVKAQTLLLASVSHELRNPLHALQGVAELLVNESLPPRALTLATELLSQLTGLTDLTQDLLDTAQASAGTVRVRPAHVALHPLVREVVRYGEAMANGAGSSALVHCTIDPLVPELVMSDAVRLRQILRNLVGNAIKFTPAGEVHLNVSVIASGVLRFSVRDTGAGIPQEDLDRIREPFVTGALAGSQGGAGLGLSIVHRTVNALGGALQVSSLYGSGSTVAVDLPIPAVNGETPVPAPTDNRVVSTRSDPTGCVVLVVEDNVVNQQLAQGQLSRLGMVAHVVGSGEEAVELLRSTACPAFDVVLMDHGLPGMDGVETMKAMRLMGGDVARIPVICVTASAAGTDRHRFLAEGMDGFVSKPASLAAIRDGIAEVLATVRIPRPVDPPSTDESQRDGSQRDGSQHLAAGPVADPKGTLSSAGPSRTRGAAIDAALASLCADFEDPQLVASLVDAFISEMPSRLDSIVAGHLSRDSSRAAHTLKSSARLMGAMELGDTCEAVEKGAGLDAPHLRDEADAVVRHLRAWLAGRAR